MQITVLGATGGVGRAITTELATRGHDVTAVSRSVTPADAPEGVRIRPADLSDRAATATACEGADVVVMSANVPYADWATQLGPLVDSALAATVATDARFVMVDNLYGYGSPGTPITDDSPEASPTRKGRLRRDLGRRLLAAHADGRARVTIGRFSDYSGPWGEHSLLGMLGVDRALAGKRPHAFIDADQPHTFAYLPDAARGFATLIEQPEADGRSWIIPAHAPITQRDALRVVCEAAGAPVRLGRISPAMLWATGLFDPQLREAREQVPQFDRPYIVTGLDFEANFGPLATTPHAQALAATVEARRGVMSVGA